MNSNLGLIVESLLQSVAGFTVDADFSVAPGERLALTGPSGSGKTTLVRILTGLLPLLGSGRIMLAGREITQERPNRRRIGVVFQEQTLFPALNVLENVIFGLRMQGASRAKAEKQGREWLARVGLADRESSEVTVLSGGERQRVAFARALIWKPDLILLDEPFSALDRERRGELQRILLELHEAAPAPLILVTHDNEDVSAIATARLSVEVSPSGKQRRFRR